MAVINRVGEFRINVHLPRSRTRITFTNRREILLTDKQSGCTFNYIDGTIGLDANFCPVKISRPGRVRRPGSSHQLRQDSRHLAARFRGER